MEMASKALRFRVPSFAFKASADRQGSEVQRLKEYKKTKSNRYIFENKFADGLRKVGFNVIAKRLTVFPLQLSAGEIVSACPVKFREADSPGARFNRVNLCASVAN